ncbi:MAG: hypothetical protein ACFCUX_04845 [Candidatus Methylacidiphilales bacterium]
MKTTIYSVLCMMVCLVMSGRVQAQDASGMQADTGKILSTVGSVTILLPGESTPKPAIKGQPVPEGSTLITADGSQCMVGLTAGASTLVESGSELTVDTLQIKKSGNQVSQRNIELELKSGSNLSFLKQMGSISDYSVKTPIGVAAARGTIWRSSNEGIQVADGVVTFTLPDGTQVSVPAGKQMTPDGEVDVIDDQVLQNLADAITTTTKLKVNLKFLDNGTAQIVILNSDNQVISTPSFNPVTTSDGETNNDQPPAPPAPPAPDASPEPEEDPYCYYFES